MIKECSNISAYITDWPSTSSTAQVLALHKHDGSLIANSTKLVDTFHYIFHGVPVTWMKVVLQGQGTVLLGFSQIPLTDLSR